MKRIALILATLVLLLAACRQENNEVLNAIDAAEAQWREVGITNYALATAWQPAENESQLVEVVVLEGEVADVIQDCMPDPSCAVAEINPEDFTAEGLFALARELSPEIEEIAFDDVTGTLDMIVLADGRIYEAEINFGGFAPR